MDAEELAMDGGARAAKRRAAHITPQLRPCPKTGPAVSFLLEAMEPRVLLAGDLVSIANPAPALNDYFGNAVAAMGTTRVVIGAFGDDATASDSGSAYLADSATGEILRTFTNPTPAAGDQFGLAVAGVGSNRVAVAAPRDDIKRTNAGAVYIFNADDGTLVKTLYSPNPQPFDYFGSSLAVVGQDRILVGSYNDDTVGTDTGAAYLFDVNTGALIQTFSNPTPAAGDLFGFSVTALDDDTIAIGAPGDDAGAADSGVVHLFSVSTGAKLRTITHPQAAASNNFGYSIAGLGGTRLAVGTPNRAVGADFAGVVYVMNPADGTRLLTITNPTPNALEFFGRSIAGMGGGTLLVGVPSDDSIGLKSGTVYAFDATDGTILRTIVNPRLRPNDQFGYSLAALGPDHAIAGAWNDSTGASTAGAVHVVTIDPPPPAIGTLTASPAPASFGQLITLTGSGVNASSTQLFFYIDSNRDGELQTDGDFLLSASPNTATGTIIRTLQSSSLSPDTYTLFAVPVDVRGVLGNIAQSSVTINDAPAPADHPFIGALLANPGTVAPGGSVALTADNVSVSTGSISSITFYRDTNNNGTLDSFVDEPIGTDNSADGGWSLTITTDQLAVSNGRVFARARASNGTYSKPAVATVNVQAPATNHAPTVDLVTPVNNASMTTTTPRFAWTATDPDGDAMSYDLRITDLLGNAVRTIRFPAPGPLEYTLQAGEALAVGDYFWSVVANDGHGNTADSPTRRLTIAAPPVNHPPTISPLTPAGNASADDTTPTFTWSASDADNDPLTFTLNILNSQGAAVRTLVTAHPATLALTLANDQALAPGTYNWTIAADDGKASPVTTTPRPFTITSPPPVNQPPAIAAITPTVGATTDDPTPTFTWSASDPENDAMSYTLTITSTANSQVVHTATLVSPASLTYTLPDINTLANGTYSWTVSANDGHNSAVVTAARNFTIALPTEPPANLPPAVTPLTPDAGATTDDATPTFTWSASDPENDALNFTLTIRDTANQVVHTVTLNGPASLTYSVPGVNALVNGTYSWTVAADDGTNAPVVTAPRSFTLSVPTEPPVDPVNLPPTVNALAPAAGITINDRTPTFTWSASDPENNPLSFTLTVRDAIDQLVYATVLSAPASQTYTLPDVNALTTGTYSWTVAADDGANTPVITTSRSFTLIVPTDPPVDPVNLPPTVTPLVPADGNTSDDPTPTFTWAASDPENNTLSFTLTIRNSANQVVHTATLSSPASQSYTLPDNDALANGTYTWTVSADDGTNAPIVSTPRGFTIDVVNDPPPGGGNAPPDTNGTPQTATPATPDGDPISDSLAPENPDEVDWFAFALDGLSFLDVTTTGVNEGNLKLSLFTSADTATPIVTSGGGYASIQRRGGGVLDAGSFLVKVERVQGLDVPGDYDISILATPVFDVLIGAGQPSTLKFTDGDSTAVSVVLKQAIGHVFLSGSNVAATTKRDTLTVTGSQLALADLVMTDTQAKTTLAVNGKSGDGVVELGGVSADGAMKSITGKTTRLTGTTNVAGSLKSLTLMEARGAVLAVGAPADAKTTLTLKVKTAEDFTVVSNTPIASLAADDWTGGDALSAPWFKSITVKGTLSAAVTATGANDKGVSIDKLKASTFTDASLAAAGVVKSVAAGDWTGDGSDIAAAAWFGSVKITGTLSATLQTTGQDAKGRGIPSLAAGSVVNGSILASAGIGAVKVGQWIDGSITAAWADTITSAGDFSPDMTLTGASAGPTLNKLVVKTVLRDGTIRITGDVNLIDAGAARDATVMIGVTGQSAPDSADDFTPGIGTLKTLTVRSIKGDAAASFIDTLIAARAVGKVTLREVATVGGPPFGLIADTLASYKRTAQAGTARLTLLDTPGILDGTDAYRVLIV